MPKIILDTRIKSQINYVFDLSRSVDVHLQSAEESNEKAVAGKIKGLLNLGDTVTWRAKHLGIYQSLSVQITEMNPPFNFTDSMLKGAFKSFNHRHLFQQQGEWVVMRDEFQFVSPFGFFGRCFDRVFLTHYMTRFLKQRNAVIKDLAEKKTYKV